ncbi:hypothetical protein [Kumtagia ephedrae]|uniref:hypothetical protein n=1 Tax=Kumtagia ephedrae TaxID=2116701 RepID=UPI00105723E8|nr:hypothetical protein [Mesorhizobium ephedrae]
MDADTTAWIIWIILILFAAYFTYNEVYIKPRLIKEMGGWDLVEAVVVNRIHLPEDPPAFSYRVRYRYKGKDCHAFADNDLNINTVGVVIGHRFSVKIDPKDHGKVVIFERNYRER